MEPCLHLAPGGHPAYHIVDNQNKVKFPRIGFYCHPAVQGVQGDTVLMAVTSFHHWPWLKLGTEIMAPHYDGSKRLFFPGEEDRRRWSTRYSEVREGRGAKKWS